MRVSTAGPKVKSGKLHKSRLEPVHTPMYTLYTSSLYSPGYTMTLPRPETCGTVAPPRYALRSDAAAMEKVLGS